MIFPFSVVMPCWGWKWKLFNWRKYFAHLIFVNIKPPSAGETPVQTLVFCDKVANTIWWIAARNETVGHEFQIKQSLCFFRESILNLIAISSDPFNNFRMQTWRKWKIFSWIFLDIVDKWTLQKIVLVAISFHNMVWFGDSLWAQVVLKISFVWRRNNSEVNLILQVSGCHKMFIAEKQQCVTLTYVSFRVIQNVMERFSIKQDALRTWWSSSYFSKRWQYVQCGHHTCLHCPAWYDSRPMHNRWNSKTSFKVVSFSAWKMPREKGGKDAHDSQTCDCGHEGRSTVVQSPLTPDSCNPTKFGSSWRPMRLERLSIQSRTRWWDANTFTHRERVRCFHLGNTVLAEHHGQRQTWSWCPSPFQVPSPDEALLQLPIAFRSLGLHNALSMNVRTVNPSFPSTLVLFRHFDGGSETKRARYLANSTWPLRDLESKLGWLKNGMCVCSNGK